MVISWERSWHEPPDRGYVVDAHITLPLRYDVLNIITANIEAKYNYKPDDLVEECDDEVRE